MNHCKNKRITGQLTGVLLAPVFWVPMALSAADAPGETGLGIMGQEVTGIETPVGSGSEGITAAIGDTAALEAALQAYGWLVERQENGDLIVYPPGVRHDSQISDAPSPEVIVHGREERPSPLQSAEPDDSQPGSGAMADPESGTKPVLGVATPETLALAIAADDLDTLQNVAELRGWTTQRSPDGSLLLYPPGALSAPLGTTPCQTGMTRITAAEGQYLDVGSEAQALELAQAWLLEQGLAELTVGRVRQVNRLYLVSIVTAQSPYFLRQQLVINAADGCLLAIPR